MGSVVKHHLQQLAEYNRWANARLYQAALTLNELDYRRNVGAFFKSLHGTLNHLLLTDRLWLKRLTSVGDHPSNLGAILYEDRVQLALARAEEDDRLVSFVATLDDNEISGPLTYMTTTGKKYEQSRADILTHLFNHQTHHRGQAHTILTICAEGESPQLDLLAMQRGQPAPDLRELASMLM